LAQAGAFQLFPECYPPCFHRRSITDKNILERELDVHCIVVWVIIIQVLF
jgi:hypothetical protein